MAAQPTTEQLQRTVRVICKVIGQIPCFQIYEDYIARRFGAGEAEISLMAMTHNAALDSALLNLRCFNEFFKPDGRKDDVRVTHFPGLLMQPFLDPDDEQAINKHLAHLTLPRADVAAAPWLLDKMALLGLQHGIQFLTFIESGFPMNSEAADAEVSGIREAASLFLLKISKSRRSQDG